MVIQMVTTLLYNKYLKYLISLYYKSMLNLIHLKKSIFSLIGWFTAVYYQKIITIIIFFFRKDILDSLFDGYDAWISPSFDKSKSPPHTYTIPVKMITYL